MTLAQLLDERQHILLDFDGPVCSVFGGVPAGHVAQHYAGILRAHHVPLPASTNEADDPFEVLRAAATAQPASATFAEMTLRDLEVHAVDVAPITTGARAALTAFRAAGHTVTIVSNNSTAAVEAFVSRLSLVDLITDVVGRTEPDPDLLKPNPHLVRRAVVRREASPAECILIGDSDTDVIAAQAAGTAVVAYANKPGKLDTLARLGPDYVITTWAEIINVVGRQPAP